MEQNFFKIKFSKQVFQDIWDALQYEISRKKNSNTYIILSKTSFSEQTFHQTHQFTF